MKLPATCALVAALCALPAAARDDDTKAAEARAREGDALRQAGKHAEALAAYEQAMDLDPGYVPAYEAATPLWFSAQQYDTAAKRLQVITARKPKYAVGWYSLAFAYRKTKAFDKAVGAYATYIELRPTEADPYFGLGMTYKQLGDPARARAALEKYVAMEKRPEKQKFVDQAKAELGALGAAAAGGVGTLNPATATPRDLAGALKKEGDARRDAGDAAGAEAKYREAGGADPTWGAPHAELGALLLGAGKDADGTRCPNPTAGRWCPLHQGFGAGLLIFTLAQVVPEE